MRLIFFLFILVACTKTFIRQECKSVYAIKQTWTDSAAGYIKSDTLWKSNGVVCGLELARFEAVAPTWVHVCASEPQHWEYYITETK